MAQKILLEYPKHFSFRQTVNSHGWSALLPFVWDGETSVLSRVFYTHGHSAAVNVSLGRDGAHINIKCGDKLNKKSREKIVREVGHVLRFDDDLSDFYRMAKSDKALSWIAGHKAGRIMRSPTVFEDLVKTICTTNCSWAMTKIMTRNLVEKLGAKTSCGRNAFPTPEAMANKKTEFYTAQIKAGYRASYLKELAQKVADGKFDPESWLTTDLPTDELKKEMKQVKGVGDYAADNLLKLVGRYDGLALDSFLRAEFYKTHREGSKCSDKEIEKHYERFGKWRGLVIWCDMTKEHIHETGKS